MRPSSSAAVALLLAATASPRTPGARPPAGATSATPRLAEALRRLYEGPGAPGERWRHRPPEVTLDDGRRVEREAAYRDRPEFVGAAAELLESPTGDDALLGAWLLGTAPVERRGEAAAVLVRALFHDDHRVRFEAARVLGEVGAAPATRSLKVLADAGTSPASTAALWALRRIAERADEDPAAESSLASSFLAGVPGSPPPDLPPGFCRGVNWWQEEDRGDAGAASFRALAELGVDWISIHTWDPLQRDVHSPEWAEPRRPLAIPKLAELVRNAHAAGIKVMVKPHLEMRGREPTPSEWRILRGPDERARQELINRWRAEGKARPPAWHNDIEMKTEADWQRWFARYEEYVLSYVRQAAAVGADAFCVGRETDKAAIAREADWRRLIARVREAFKGPLTYSANFDSYGRVGFWDALDVIGISAYFPLDDRETPSAERVAAAWDGVMGRLEAFARKTNRRVVFTEIGYPAVATAARRPWDDAPGPADVWLQARLYEAALRAVSSRPFMAGAFFWLWEGVARPPFRDASFSIQDKPASFVMARWYAKGP